MSTVIETPDREDYQPGIGLFNITRAEGSLSDEDSGLVDELFTYHPWTPEMIERGETVRNALANAYKTILENVPSSPTRTRALNCLTDARMLANAAITFKGAV